MSTADETAESENRVYCG